MPVDPWSIEMGGVIIDRIDSQGACQIAEESYRESLFFLQGNSGIRLYGATCAWRLLSIFGAIC
jgi:hypothetical protein